MPIKPTATSRPEEHGQTPLGQEQHTTQPAGRPLLSRAPPAMTKISPKRASAVVPPRRSIPTRSGARSTASTRRTYPSTTSRHRSRTERRRSADASSPPQSTPVGFAPFKKRPDFFFAASTARPAPSLRRLDRSLRPERRAAHVPPPKSHAQAKCRVPRVRRLRASPRRPPTRSRFLPRRSLGRSPGVAPGRPAQELRRPRAHRGATRRYRLAVARIYRKFPTSTTCSACGQTRSWAGSTPETRGRRQAPASGTRGGVAVSRALGGPCRCTGGSTGAIGSFLGEYPTSVGVMMPPYAAGTDARRRSPSATLGRTSVHGGGERTRARAEAARTRLAPSAASAPTSRRRRGQLCPERRRPSVGGATAVFVVPFLDAFNRRRARPAALKRATPPGATSDIHGRRVPARGDARDDAGDRGIVSATLTPTTSSCFDSVFACWRAR